MKQIEVGKTYHNGKTGRFYAERKVIAEGPEHVLYSGQENHDCIRYLQQKGRNRGGQSNITRQSFAIWAKGIAEEEKP